MVPAQSRVGCCVEMRPAPEGARAACAEDSVLFLAVQATKRLSTTRLARVFAEVLGVRGGIVERRKEDVGVKEWTGITSRHSTRGRALRGSGALPPASLLHSHQKPRSLPAIDVAPLLPSSHRGAPQS